MTIRVYQSHFNVVPEFFYIFVVVFNFGGIDLYHFYVITTVQEDIVVYATRSEIHFKIVIFFESLYLYL